MGFKCGIVGLPNVGKSTLFNALTATAAAEAANYPFCTIEPNVGIVSVPDDRLEKLAKLASSLKIIYTQLEFVDIAGLVKGASKGEGLGNKFLAHIREVDAIIQVLRCFENDDIIHTEARINPIADLEIIELELTMADLESLERQKISLQKKAKNDQEAKKMLELAEKLSSYINEGKSIRTLDFSQEDASLVNKLQLLTTKPVLYVANVAESDAATGNKYSKELATYLAERGDKEPVIISSQIESEISLFATKEEKLEFLEAIGLKETGLNKIIREGYKLLNLASFFTIGPKEAHAWTIPANCLAPDAAGVIHTDFKTGFIRAEVISYQDYIQCNGETGAKEAGKMRLEGKEYRVKDGDIIHFRFNV